MFIFSAEFLHSVINYDFSKNLADMLANEKAP